MTPDEVQALSASATAVGVLLALGFGVIAEVRLALDRVRRTDDARRSHAAKIYAWLAPESDAAAAARFREVGNTAVRRTLGGIREVVLVLHNGSGALIYDVKAHFVRPTSTPRWTSA